ncbi:NAD kinase [Candidatus Bandiella euplotis]|uniref:NAD kinase n=1 Tax=Candidatus Bandiella euplotis TaxID=1664265 RepID=A0ABZ0UK44_9RICK|nr:NAD kinase [Candidatus Bandiella woodruffii]WPX96490.1 putative inorganic polyphosphate/ATP-NAD kinase [Candidatus Bandiella woodruffii]
MINNLQIGCLYNKESKNAVDAFEKLSKTYNLVELSDANLQMVSAIITLGGDGEMLRALHMSKHTKTPIYGMNRGSLGFLLNKYDPNNLIEKVGTAQIVKLYPLKMIATTNHNETVEAHAFNEVSLLRETNQIAKIKITIDGVLRMNALHADGILLSTPAGSTAYNFAAHGPIIPLNSNLLSLMPISPFRPRRWDGALILRKSRVQLEILEWAKRPVSAVADSKEVRDIKSVEIYLDFSLEKQLLFDKNNSLNERVFKEQFYYDSTA